MQLLDCEKVEWCTRLDSNKRPFASEANDPPRVLYYLHAFYGRYVDKTRHFQLTAAFFMATTFLFPGFRFAAVTIFSDSRSSTSDACWLGACV